METSVDEKDDGEIMRGREGQLGGRASEGEGGLGMAGIDETGCNDDK